MLDPERAADSRGARTHVGQSEVAGTEGMRLCIDRDAAAVVADFEFKSLLADCEADANCVCVRMDEGVVDGLLSYPIGRQLNFAGQALEVVTVYFDLDADVRSFLDALREPFECRHEPQFVEDRKTPFSHQVPQLIRHGSQPTCCLRQVGPRFGQTDDISELRQDIRMEIGGQPSAL